MGLSDVEWIFIVLAVMYLLESVCWVRTGTIAHPYWMNHFRSPKSAWRLLGNERGAIILGGVLPTDATFLTRLPSLSLGDHGLSTFMRAAPGGVAREDGNVSTFASWPSVEKLRADQRDILLDQQVICRCQSDSAARSLAQQLIEISGADATQRGDKIEDLQRGWFDQRRAASRIGQWHRGTRRLRLASLVLFILIFPVGLLQYYEVIGDPGDGELLLWYLGGILLVWWWSVLEANLSHRMLYPDRRAARFKLLFMTMVSPVVPLRAADHLARELFGGLHPLTFVVATDRWASEATEDESIATEASTMAHDAAGQTVRDLVFPSLPLMPANASNEEMAVIQQAHERMTEHVQDVVDSIGLEFEEMFQPPERIDPGAQSFCPRCLQEFTVASASCDHCGGQSTKPMSG